jgi:hypothetical protein
MRRLLPKILLNVAIPILTYFLVRPHVDSDTTALVAGFGFPVAFTLVMFMWQKRLDPIGAVAVAGYGIALLVSLLSGGNPLVLKLHEAILTGPLGVICLLSLVMGKPLHLVLHKYLARRNNTVITGRARRASVVITGLVGAMLVIHALVLLLLALSLPTGTYLVVSRPIGLSILAVGAGAIFWYRRRLRTT